MRPTPLTVVFLHFDPCRLRLPALFFFNLPATPDISTLSLHDALPISTAFTRMRRGASSMASSLVNALMAPFVAAYRSEEHTSELQSLRHLVCRLLLEKKKTSFSPPSYD